MGVGICALLLSALQSDSPEPPRAPDPKIEVGLGVWDTFKADEAFVLSLYGRIPVHPGTEIWWGIEAAPEIGTDLESSDPADSPGPWPARFDVDIYGFFLSWVWTPPQEREPGMILLTVGGGGGFYLGHLVEDRSPGYAYSVRTETAAGAHAFMEVEILLTESSWFFIQGRRVWLEFEEDAFRLPSGTATGAHDFSGWQIQLGFGASF